MTPSPRRRRVIGPPIFPSLEVRKTKPKSVVKTMAVAGQESHAGKVPFGGRAGASSQFLLIEGLACMYIAIQRESRRPSLRTSYWSRASPHLNGLTDARAKALYRRTTERVGTGIELRKSYSCSGCQAHVVEASRYGFERMRSAH